jgi:hypothetical protein
MLQQLLNVSPLPIPLNKPTDFKFLLPPVYLGKVPQDKQYTVYVVGNYHCLSLHNSMEWRQEGKKSAKLENYIDQLTGLTEFMESRRNNVIPLVILLDFCGLNIDSARLHALCAASDPIQAAEMEFRGINKIFEDFIFKVRNINPKSKIIALPNIYNPSWYHRNCDGSCSFRLTNLLINRLSKLNPAKFRLNDISRLTTKTCRTMSRDQCLYRRMLRHGVYLPNGVELHPRFYLKVKFYIEKLIERIKKEGY